jgi:biotin transport system substrate-specific component
MSNYANPVLTSNSFPRRRVLGDTLPGARLRDTLLVLAGAGLTILGAQITIHVPGSPVPITAQTLAVVLAGSALGARRGAGSQLLYVVLGLFLPVYAGGQSGWSVIWGPDGGYLIGFIVAAWVTGTAAERGADREPKLALVAFAVGQLAIYAIGVPWLKVAMGWSWGQAIHEGFTIFILGGVIKAIVAAIAMPTAWRIQRYISSD